MSKLQTVISVIKILVSKNELDKEEEKSNRCSCCNSMYVNMNYIKLLQHITPKEKLRASDFKRPIVFEDRYGCRCTFCESCVLSLQFDWDNYLRKRIRTHHENVSRLPRNANRTIEYHSDGIDPFDNNH